MRVRAMRDSGQTEPPQWPQINAGRLKLASWRSESLEQERSSRAS